MGMVQWIQMTSPTFVHQTSLGQRWSKGFKCKILVLRLGYKESTPLKNMSSSVGILIPNIWKNKKCSKPPTRCKKDLNPFYPLGVAIFDVPLEIFLRKSPTFPKPQAGRTRLLQAHPPQDVDFVAIGPTKCGISQTFQGEVQFIMDWIQMGMVQWIQMTYPTFVHQTSLGQRWSKGFKCKIRPSLSGILITPFW